MASPSATLKDVIYGMQFLGERLCMWPGGKGSGMTWTLEPSGLRVPQKIADQVKLNPGVFALPDGLAGQASYGWRQAA